MKKVTSITAIVWMTLASATWAGQPPSSITMIPPQINYQGRLVTVNNTPYTNALHMIDLALYPEASATKLYSERHFVQTRDGYFSVNLGTGTPLGTYPSLWQALWKTNAADTDKFFMGITVWTDPVTGRTNSTAVEATPRQQFLSAPFAMRSFQSVYASKSDGIFSAPQGVSTTAISSPTNNQVAVNADLRVSTTETIYANEVIGHGSSPTLRLLSNRGVVELGSYERQGDVRDYASSIYIGVQPVPAASCPGTDVSLRGKSVDIVTTNLTVNNQSMFVWNTGSGTLPGGGSNINISHGIDATAYDVCVVGWYGSLYTPAIRYIRVSPGQSYATVQCNEYVDATHSASITIYFLGIRKDIVKKL